jgi:general secretion pathway protein L
MPGALMAENDEPIDLASAARLVWQNWLHEWKIAWGPLLFAGTSETLIRVTPDALEVHSIDADEIKPIGSAPLESGKVDIRALRALAEKCGPSHDITLLLPAEAALRPRLSLPNAGRKAIRGALAYEIERISPIPPAGLYYDYAVTGQTGNLADLELRLVKRDGIDSHVTACQAAGLAVAKIEFEDDSQPADWRNFPVDRDAHLRRFIKRHRRIGLIALATLLFVGVLGATYERQSEKLDAAIAASADAGLRAARIEKIQQKIAAASHDLRIPAEQKHQPLMVAILAELTQVLPDGTWINELTFDGKTIRITGSSTAAADLIGLIDRSPKFANARFEAPLIHDQATNADRFDLSFAVRGL